MSPTIQKRLDKVKQILDSGNECNTRFYIASNKQACLIGGEVYRKLTGKLLSITEYKYKGGRLDKSVGEADGFYFAFYRSTNRMVISFDKDNLK